METLVWHLHPQSPDPVLLAQAAERLRGGELVAIPTETVYGLAANALSAGAVRRIFAAKGRPTFNPLIVHVADADMARSLVLDWPATADLLAQKFWPGPLTLVLPRNTKVPEEATGAGPTVGLRCPSHPVARGLIQAAGLPLAAPSANLSCQLSPTTAAHVLRDLGGKIELVLDAGPTPGGLESTVVDLSVTPPRLLRPGPIRRELLESLLGPLEWSSLAVAGAVPRSPGQLERHYAPRTPLELFSSARAMCQRLDQTKFQGEQVGVVGFDQARQISSTGKLRFHPGISRLHWLPDDPVGYAAKLYFVLHDLDERKLDRILLLLPPDEPAWLAVRDRLLRAGQLIASPAEKTLG